MPKKVKELTNTEVKAITKRVDIGMHPVGGVSGLMLQVRSENSASWILRTLIKGRRRNIGLGSYPEVTLAKARAAAADIKYEAKHKGVDPVELRRANRVETIKEKAREKTFFDLANEYIEKRSVDFKTEQQVRKLTKIFETYAYPTLKNMRIAEIDLNTIHSVLVQTVSVPVKDENGKRIKDKDGKTVTENKPLWEGKTETASRLRIYLTHVFDAAIARGIYTELNPARWDGGLKALLTAPQKTNKTKHHEAMQVEDLPEFWAKLTQQEWQSAKVLQFGILTGARSAEMRGARWSEIDFNEKVWRLPANRMKGTNPRPHNVPLSNVALNFLDSMPRESEYIFPSSKGGELTDATISKVPKRLGYDVTAHGFRSTFKDWARRYVKFNHDSYDDDVTELALAHVNNDSTRAAYARNELLDERRPLMQEWANYCTSRLNNVVSIQGAK